DDGCETEIWTAEHCGSCMKACSADRPLCAGSQCVTSCPAGTPVMCGSTCTNLDDPKNCGACGHDCTRLPNVASSGNVACSAGKCVIPSNACAQGFDHCTTNADDGCETDITKPEHCRACATKCSAERPLCGVTGCTACPPGLRPCNGACVDPSVDPTCGGYLLG